MDNTLIHNEIINIIEDSLDYVTVQVTTSRAIDDVINTKATQLLTAVTQELTQQVALQTLTEDRAIFQISSDIVEKVNALEVRPIIKGVMAHVKTDIRQPPIV